VTLPDAKPATAKSLYAVGAAALGLQALVLLLAAPAVISLERGHVSWVKVGYMLALAVLLIAGAAVLRRPGGKVFGSALQVLTIAGGIITWPMYVVGAAFAGIWVYWLALWPRHTSPDSVLP
jgi:hypothetical protein